jgi:hypothetical protein
LIKEMFNLWIILFIVICFFVFCFGLFHFIASKCGLTGSVLDWPILFWGLTGSLLGSVVRVIDGTSLIQWNGLLYVLYCQLLLYANWLFKMSRIL